MSWKAWLGSLDSRELLGSSFLAKLIFQDGNYRISVLNPALALILQKNRGLYKEKAEDMIISENVPSDLERSGIEPLTSTMPSLRSTNWANAPKEEILVCLEILLHFKNKVGVIKHLFPPAAYAGKSEA
jgi:hypothetical protein